MLNFIAGALAIAVLGAVMAGLLVAMYYLWYME